MVKAFTLVLLGFVAFPSFATTPKVTCDYTIGFSRSDVGSQEYYKVTVPGDGSDTFSFNGCSTEYTKGQWCVKNYGVAAGSRLLRNQKGEVVAEGDCCNGVQNKVTSIFANCAIRIGIPGKL